ncbi:MAG: hypothetical protein IJ851_01820 [Eubacterium sp.]|nr:hypothetical protein [Eubacterium sp.]
MVYLERDAVGIYNPTYFSIDIIDGNFNMGGKKYILGQFLADVANLFTEYIKGLLRLTVLLFENYSEIQIAGGYLKDNFIKARTQVNDILNYIQDTAPFCHFNIDQGRELLDKYFCDSSYERYDSLETAEDISLLDDANQLLKSICYIGNDIANFNHVIINFTEFIMMGNSRKKDSLAIDAFMFFSSEKYMQFFEQANAIPYMAGVNLRPWVTQVPVAIPDFETDSVTIARRLYFTRFMDFLITELFEALSHGHYLWKCGVCGKYFLMTTAHNRMYCSDVNEDYGAPCSNVASHPNIVKKKLKKEDKKNSPIYILWQKRYNSIRKNKSTGKYSAAVSAEAKKIIDAKRDRARIDFDYAKSQYEKEMDLELIYEEAMKNVDA